MKNRVFKLIGFGLNIAYKFNPKWAVLKAAKLFSLPQKRPIPLEKKVFLETAKWEKLELDNKVLQVYKWTEASSKTVLLAHGWESNAARWQDLIKYLIAEKYLVVALDAPGHGNSDGPLFDQLLYKRAVRILIRKYEAEVVIGHSLGGFTALWGFYDQPVDTVQKLVFMGTPVSMLRYYKGFVQSFGLSKSLKLSFEKHLSNIYGLDINDFSFLNITEGLGVSTLFVHDKEDKIVTYEPTAKMAHQWKNTQLFTTIGFGHSLRDDSVYKAIIKFLKEK